MSDMNSNPHYANARRWDNKPMGAVDVALMAAQATLALAFEQRTANLIALATMNPQWYGSTSQESFDQIDARLGLIKKED